MLDRCVSRGKFFIGSMKNL
uniref:Uncharacterized protein n=1 Tax=Rhizophora mucronata TaxID=61149 RepID=A0A2P2Q7I2_RHIMU